MRVRCMPLPVGAMDMLNLDLHHLSIKCRPAPAEVKWTWLLPLILGSLIGGYLGANLAIKSGNKWIKIIFEIMTISAGTSLIIKAI